MDSRPRQSLLWSDEFADHTSGKLDPATWNMDLGDGAAAGLVGWGNNEREFYTSDSIVVKDSLIIHAIHQGTNSPIETYYGPAEWTSGKIHTAKKVGFKFGRIEVRAKMPSGQGTWPAIWLLGASLNEGVSWPECGEIDIFEGTGAHPSQVQGTIHGPGYFGNDGLTKLIQAANPLSDEFHTFAISWHEDSIEWFFDGVSYNKITRADSELQGKAWPFNAEFYLIINLAIGGWFAGEVDPNLRAAQLEIEWIKYYSENGIGELFLH